MVKSAGVRGMGRELVLRCLLVLALVAVLFGLCVWYGSLAPAPELGAYPNEDELAMDYAHYVGGYATVTGMVVTTEPVTIDADTGTGERIRLHVVDLSVAVEAGDRLQVYGVVGQDRTIRAVNAYTVPRTGLWYTWTVSFLAGLWVLGRIIRHWRVDSTAWVFEPRARPLGRRTGARIRAVLGGGSDDA